MTQVLDEPFVRGGVDFEGATVRFCQVSADGKPGALQREYFMRLPDGGEEPAANRDG